jgi:hypothetical protein
MAEESSMPSSSQISSLLFLLLAFASGGASAEWTLTQGDHPSQTGRIVDAARDGHVVARFVHGAGQMKPYLHVFEDGVQLTKGDGGGNFPHHRGIFIGWNQVETDGKRNDLWHLNDGSSMAVLGVERLQTSPEAATIMARIEWRGSTANGAPVLVDELRTMSISRPGGNRTQVDTFFQLRAVRDLTLDGDRHHAGVHFRAAQEVYQRLTETSYLSSPQGGDGVSGSNLRWCRLLFPIGARWFSAQQLSSPGNPSLEISMRNYGRFGFFFRKSMVAGEMLALSYRFITHEALPPAVPGAPTSAEIVEARARSDEEDAAVISHEENDWDGDGRTHAEEAVAGTNPFDAASQFRILRFELAGGYPGMEFPYFAGRNYRIWKTSDFLQWDPVDAPSLSFPSVGVARWVDLETPRPVLRFYKVGIE